MSDWRALKSATVRLQSKTIVGKFVGKKTLQIPKSL